MCCFCFCLWFHSKFDRHNSICFHFSTLPWKISTSFPQDFKFMAGKLKWQDNLKNNFSLVAPRHSCKGNKCTQRMKWAWLPWRQSVRVYVYTCACARARVCVWDLGTVRKATDQIESVSPFYAYQRRLEEEIKIPSTYLNPHITSSLIFLLVSSYEMI